MKWRTYDQLKNRISQITLVNKFSTPDRVFCDSYLFSYEEYCYLLIFCNNIQISRYDNTFLFKSLCLKLFAINITTVFTWSTNRLLIWGNINKRYKWHIDYCNPLISNHVCVLFQHSLPQYFTYKKFIASLYTLHSGKLFFTRLVFVESSSDAIRVVVSAGDVVLSLPTHRGVLVYSFLKNSYCLY